MADTTPLVRQWTLLHILSSRRQGATVGELMSELDANDKMIRRDLQFLASNGFPLVESVGDRGKKSWTLSSGVHAPALNFNFTEVLSLYLGRRALEPLAGTNIWQGAQSAYTKIRATLGEGAIAYLEKLSRVLQPTHTAVGDYSAKADLIELLLMAIEDRKITWIVYQSANATEPVSTEVYPLTLLWHRGSLYLLAHAREDDKVKTYKVDRVSGVDVTHLKFTFPNEFDAQQFLSSSFGIMSGANTTTRVRIRFSSSVARYITERKWHASQQLSKQRDNTLIAEFELGDLHEFKAWLLSFAQHAEVLEPESLRTEMRDTIQAMQQVYEQPPAKKPSRRPPGFPR